MAQYFYALTDKDTVQIDDTTARFHITRQDTLDKCGALTSNIQLGVNGYDVASHIKYVACYTVQLVSGKESFITLKLNFDVKNSVGAYCCRWSTNEYRIYVYSADYAGITATDSSVVSNITCYFWGTGSQSADRFGLQIFNASGTPIFHSSDYMMDITGMYKSTHSPNNSYHCFNEVDTQIPITKSLLIVQMPACFTSSRYTGDMLNRAIMGLYAKNGTYWLHGFWSGGLYTNDGSVDMKIFSCFHSSTFQAYLVDTP